MTGWVVLAVSCLVTAVVIPVALAWSRLQQWRYPRPEDVQLGEEVDGPLPAGAVEIWARYDPSPLGFRPLGVVHASAYVAPEGLTKVWAQDGCVASVTCRQQRSGDWACRRRSFITYFGDRAAPATVGTAAGTSARVQASNVSGVQVLFWPAEDSATLLEVHRRQTRARPVTPLPVASLDDARAMSALASTAALSAELASGRLRETSDGRLALTRRALVRALGAQLPTPGAAFRRADRRARRTVAGWPETGEQPAS